MSQPLRYTITDSRRGLIVQLLDENGAAVNVTGWAARLQGASLEIGTNLDFAGSIFSAVEGKFLFAAVGNQITLAQAGGRSEVQFNAQVKWTDSVGGITFSDPFAVTLAKPLI